MPKTSSPQTTIPPNSRIVYRGLLFEVVQAEQPNGRTFEFARRGPGTRILVVSPDDKLLLTREFRKELGGHDLRLPGGKVFDTLAEFEAAGDSDKPLQEFAKTGASRELEEETGYRATGLDLLAVSKCGATIEWDLYYFVCTTWKPPLGRVVAHEDEDIAVVWETLSNTKELCLQGKISEERSVVQILRFIHQRTEQQRHEPLNRQ